MCLAVAQRIEHLLDGKDGRRFESYQPDHTLEAPGFRHLGLLCFLAVGTLRSCHSLCIQLAGVVTVSV
jgi:hypothetical protein